MQTKNKDIEVEQCVHDDDMLASSQLAKKSVLKQDYKRLLSVKWIQKIKTEKTLVLMVWWKRCSKHLILAAN